MDGLSALIEKTGTAAQVIGEPPLFDIIFSKGRVADYRDSIAGNRDPLLAFNQYLRAHGVLKGDSKFYVSLAHDADDIAKTLNVFEQALTEK